ncbi:hypothetical protein MBLNU457_g2889t1 [Dothideomycetes sp. NU457]
MRFPPPEVWASFPRTDPAHPVRSGSGLVVVNIIFMVLITVVVALRLFARGYLKRRFGYDDYCIALALFFALSLGLNSIIANVHYGWDRHVWDLSFNLFQPASICAFMGKVLFTFAATFTRLSLIFFYYRLIQDTNIRWFRVLPDLSIILNIVICIVFVLLSIFLCSPVESYWVFPIMANSKCLNEGTATLISGLINCAADLECTLLPIPIIMRLQLPLKQRLGVMVLLCLGIIVTAAGTVRTYFVWLSLIDSWDETWYAYQLWISACVEIDLAVLCACAPSLKPLFSQATRRLSDSITSFLSRNSSLLSLPLPFHFSPKTTRSSPMTSAHRDGFHIPVPAGMKRSPPRRRTPSASLLQSSVSWFHNPTWAAVDDHVRMDRSEGRDDIELVAYDDVKSGSCKDLEGTNVHVRESVGSSTEERRWDGNAPV